MKHPLAIKVITLSVFTILMSGFVAYKAGAFEAGSNAKADTPVKDSIHWAAPEMAPSTKSAPVFLPEPTKDTSKPKQQEQNTQIIPAPNQNAPANQNTAPPKSNYYMGGSKSKSVFTPQPADTSKPK